MDALSRVALALCVLWLAGCGGQEPVAPSRPVEPRAMSAPPALPDGVLLQLFVPATEELYRVGEDGSFTVNGRPEKPRSKYEPGRDTVSSQGLARLRAALEEAAFFTLPERIESADCVPDGTVIRNSGRKVERRPLFVSARLGERTATVEGNGDFAAPCTLAALEPIYRALDLEALGDWQAG
jgi:hypothetical protein